MSHPPFLLVPLVCQLGLAQARREAVMHRIFAGFMVIGRWRRTTAFQVALRKCEQAIRYAISKDGAWYFRRRGLIRVSIDQGDALDFLSRCTRIMNGFCALTRPNEVIVLRVDNWFGAKWLRFGGKMLGAVGVWKDEMVIPPFVPNRILRQDRYVRTDSDEYVLSDDGVEMHISQPSSENLHRRFGDLHPDTSAFWFSAGSAQNGMGSLMLYSNVRGTPLAWFAGFSEEGGWTPHKIKGASRQELRLFEDKGA